MSNAAAPPPRAAPAAAPSGANDDYSSLFEFCPIGAYRSSPGGEQLRANPALVRLNGYGSEAEMLAGVRDIGAEWYVDPARRAQFKQALERDGSVKAFVSEVYRHKTRERIWVSEHAHAVRDAAGRVLFYEGTVEEITHSVRARDALLSSEERLRQITAQLPGVVYRVRVLPDGTRRYDFVSGAVREMFGVEPEAVLADGNALTRFWHPDDRAQAAREAGEARHRGQPLVAELRIVLDDGTTKWVQLTSSAVPSDEPGHLRVGVMVDITQRKRAEAALHEADQRWKLAFDSTGDGVWDWQLATGAELLSPAGKAMYGYAPDELPDRAEVIDALTHPDDVAQMQRDRADHFAGRTPMYANEHRIRCKDGGWKWVLSRGLVIERDDAGRPRRMVGTHTDITERKLAETLRQERDRAEAANRATTRFLSRVSHELRTPLNAILGFAQLLEQGQVPPARQATWVGEILAGGRHLLGLVDDLLDLSSVQTGQQRMEFAPVDLVQVTREAWAMLAADAQRRQVRLDNRLAQTGPPLVRADARRLRQVMGNLLSNAVKYNREGGTITVQAGTDREAVVVSVADMGQGMTAEQQARLFNPFERLGAQHGRIEGTGLGLALSKQLVEAMDGTIEVASTPGRGTTVTLRLPVAADGISAART